MATKELQELVKNGLLQKAVDIVTELQLKGDIHLAVADALVHLALLNRSGVKAALERVKLFTTKLDQDSIIDVQEIVQASEAYSESSMLTVLTQLGGMSPHIAPIIESLESNYRSSLVKLLSQRYTTLSSTTAAKILGVTSDTALELLCERYGWQLLDGDDIHQESKVDRYVSPPFGGTATQARQYLFAFEHHREQFRNAARVLVKLQSSRLQPGMQLSRKFGDHSASPRF